MYRMDAPVRAVHVVLAACRSGHPPVTLRTGGRGAIGPQADFRYEIRAASHTCALDLWAVTMTRTIDRPRPELFPSPLLPGPAERLQQLVRR
jgi:hypothetical protein